MPASTIARSLACILLLGGCATLPPTPAFLQAGGPSPLRLNPLHGEAALEPAYLRIQLQPARKSGLTTQALPGVWGSAVIRLHSTDATARLTADRVITLNTSSFTGNTTNAAVFTTLRPGNYTFQITLFTGADGTGTSAAVHTTALTLVGGTASALTVTMKTTDGATSADGGTVLNTTVSDTTGFLRSIGGGFNSTLGGPAGTPVVVAGDTLVLDPLLSDSLANGGASITGGSSTGAVADLDPGVLSRVLLSYATGSVAPTGATLSPHETILTDWVRSGTEPIRGIAWTALADGTDGGTWPARGAATRTGAGTFSGTYSWNTVAGSTFVDPVPFTTEAALSTNYLLVFRYYDNTRNHHLIRIRTLPLAVVAPASIGLTVQ